MSQSIQKRGKRKEDNLTVTITKGETKENIPQEKI